MVSDTEPVYDCKQVSESLYQRDVGDISCPGLVSTIHNQTPQQV